MDIIYFIENINIFITFVYKKEEKKIKSYVQILLKKVCQSARDVTKKACFIYKGKKNVKILKRVHIFIFG